MELIEFNDLISNYLNELSSIKRFSNNTTLAYKIDLEQFVNFLHDSNISEINNITEKTIRSYLILLNELKIKKNSISRKLSVLRGFFKYLIRNNILAENPVQKFKNPKTKRILPEIITLDSFLKILKLVDEEDKNFSDTKIIFELLYGCALRVSELCNLNIGDIDLNRKILRVTGKGNKTRIIPLGEKSIPIVLEYLSKRDSANYNDPLIVLKSGRRIYPKYARRIVKKYLSKVTDISKKSPHILRHTAATHMLDNGADLLSVKEILGHENLSTTQIYTQVSIERLKKAYKKAHPKS